MRAPAYDPDEPLGAFFHEPTPGPDGLRDTRFEFASAGARVTGRLLLRPGGAGRAPLVLVGHGRGGSKDAPYMDAVLGPWAARGAAVAAIDFPLHGERGNAKLSPRLQEALRSAAPARGLDAELRVQFARQSRLDLRRAAAALASHPEVDAGRLVYAGFSMGAILGAGFCAEAPEVRAAALALGGAAYEGSEADPTRWIGRFAPRPLLFVQAERDEVISRERAEALHAAAGEPKHALFFDCAHAELPGRALKAIWAFLEPHLELGARG